METKTFAVQLLVLHLRPLNHNRAWSNILKYLRRENAVSSLAANVFYVDRVDVSTFALLFYLSNCFGFRLVYATLLERMVLSSLIAVRCTPRFQQLLHQIFL